MSLGRGDTKNEAAFLFLKKNGVEVSYDSNERVLHSKLIVIDSSVTILGSTNWTYSALRKNHESSVIISSPEIARVFAKSLEGVAKELFTWQ